MAAISNIQMFTWIGINPAASRNAIIGDFLSGGLDSIRHMSVEDVRDACASYAKRNVAPFPIILTTIQKLRMKSLVLWAKDQHRAGLPIVFPHGTTRDMFIRALEDALT